MYMNKVFYRYDHEYCLVQPTRDLNELSLEFSNFSHDFFNS